MIVQFIIGVALAIGAIGVIWKLFVKLNSIIVTTNEIVPVVKTLGEIFADDPQMIKVLYEIVQQVRTDHGSSLLDKINDTKTLVNEVMATLTEQTKEAREAALAIAQEAQKAATVLKGQLEGVEELAKIERQQAVRDRLQLDEMDAGLVRLNNMLGDVKELLADLKEAAIANRTIIDRMQEGDDKVAKDLEEAQDRSDEVAADPTKDAGAAADVFSSSPPEEED